MYLCVKDVIVVITICVKSHRAAGLKRDGGNGDYMFLALAIHVAIHVSE